MTVVVESDIDEYIEDVCDAVFMPTFSRLKMLHGDTVDRDAAMAVWYVVLNKRV